VSNRNLRVNQVTAYVNSRGLLVVNCMVTAVKVKKSFITLVHQNALLQTKYLTMLLLLLIMP